MADDITADSIRGTTFDGARRGYDRKAVDLFRDQVAAHVADLEQQLAGLRANLEQLGIDEVPNLAAEFDRVGTDITAILGEAERTATDLRRRATQDADRWRSEAESEATAMRVEAEAAAERARGDAWQESATLLQQAQAETQRLIDIAQQDALYIRAQAEREALGMTADAQRTADEMVRAARAEANQMGLEARAESERLLEGARKSAEAAQERTRALEERRAELLTEIEDARRTITELAARGGQEAETAAVADTDIAADEDDGGGDADGGEVIWSEDDGSVKLLPPGSSFVSSRVDADEMMAEVERLRSGAAQRDRQAMDDDVAPAAGERPPVGEPAEEADVGDAVAGEPMEEPEPAEPAEPEPAEPEPAEPEPAEPEPAEPEPAEPEPAEPEPADDPSALLSEREGAGADAAGAIADDAVATETRDEDDLGGLFASLRARRDEPPEDEQPTLQADPVDDVEDSGDVETAEHGASAATALPPAVGAEEAFEIRDRLLLPLQNPVLREVKRHIVDLQNGVLEELRVGEGRWSPDAGAFDDDLGPVLDGLVADAYAAGHVAAGEVTGQAPPHVADKSVAAGRRHLADALASELRAAVDTVAPDAGFRQRSAAVSRVFRSWRTDRAERAVRYIAYRAYHEGLIAGLGALDVSAVTAVTTGRPCAECPATVAAIWDPTGPPPREWELPPVHQDCVTTVLPAASIAG